MEKWAWKERIWKKERKEEKEKAWKNDSAGAGDAV